MNRKHEHPPRGLLTSDPPHPQHRPTPTELISETGGSGKIPGLARSGTEGRLMCGRGVREGRVGRGEEERREGAGLTGT